MRLTEQEIIDILDSKGLHCLNIAEYENMNTILSLECSNGHHIDASLKSVRNAHFKCPICEGKNSLSAEVSNLQVPEKSGKRIVAIDNATESVGVSVFDDKKLVFYHLFHFTGETLDRMCDNRKLLEETIIAAWEPDLIVFEDIQYQNNILTFKTLAMLLGSSLVSTHSAHIPHETVLSKTWRSHFMINGKTRVEQKKQAIDKVKTMYDINVNDDVAEAILLGKYSVDCLQRSEIKKLF